jgi:hypothetical protein
MSRSPSRLLLDSLCADDRRVHCEQLDQRLPRYDGRHIGQELLASGALAVALKAARCKGLLLRPHRTTLLIPSMPKGAMLGNSSENS